MATGGIFQLITNDGKQDRMLLATALLNKRLIEIEQTRAQNPRIKDPTPTLVDIERTHVLFMNAHFKPFAAIGYEYGKVASQAGTARLGGEAQFSIPQFGDFFNDMAFHIKLGAVTAQNAAFYNDAAANPAVGAELLSYVPFLGQRLCKKVKFTVNSNPLDDYDSDVMCFHQKFFVQPNKEVGWNKNVGQENAIQGYADVGRDPLTGRTGRGAGIRQGVELFNGPQTPKATQEAVELWVPLLFWFNQDTRLSIPSVSIPYGQRFINLELASAAEILQHQHGLNASLDNPGANPVPVPDVMTCELYINNIFVNPEIHDIFIKRIGFSLIRVHRHQVVRSNKSDESVLLQQMKWPIETMYIGLRPSENTSVTSPKMLTSWNLYAQTTRREVDLQGLSNGYSFATSLPAAAITANDYTAAFVSFTGIALDFATVLSVAGATVLTVNQLNAALTIQGYPPLIGLVGTSTPTDADIFNALPAVQTQASFQTCTPTIDMLNIEAHGVPLYRDIPASFFNSYIPFTYGGQYIRTPEDCGALMVTFNLYPGSYQPSGHVNTSRAREFYARFTSSVVNSDYPADLVVIGIAINFLLISDGSAVLRYST
jgi:hypothetical protein